jgi:hypothetical protein
MSQSILTTVAQLTDTTDGGYAVYDAHDDSIVGAYLTGAALEKHFGEIPDFIEFDVSDDAESGMSLNLEDQSGDDGSGNYGIYESEKGAVLSMYITKDAVGDEPEEAVGLMIAEADEDQFEKAEQAEDEEALDEADDMFA